MSSGTCSWLTNEEVQRGVSEGYVLIGDAPPPIRFETDDDEMLAQFGESIRQKSILCDNPAPDLQGITSMLRMVQSSDDEDDNEVTANGVEPSNCVIAISKPSSLNPNVKEFVPKGFLSSSSSTSNVSENKTSVQKIKVNGVNTKTEKPYDEKKLVDSFKSNVNLDIAQTLKNEISCASKSDSFEIKKRKNVAISTLLKFYATNEKKQTKPLKLITPDFYENSSEAPKNKDNFKIQSLNNSPNKTNPATTRSYSVVQSEPTVFNEKETALKSTHSDEAVIKKSIDKVNQWLNTPEEKKTSNICLGPIGFKRKDANTKSPSNPIDSTSNIEMKTQPSQYKPSTYAADLGKKYMAKNKKKESSKVNMWRDLDLILKERDETLLRKAQEKAIECNDLEMATS